MISREEARRQLEEMHSGYLTTLLEEQNRLGREAVLLADCEALCMAIEALSTERPKGRWEFDRHYITHNWLYRCTSCDGWNKDTPPFCPNCGSDNRGEEE